ncbi:hypothetical protein MHU86_7157 [Fragilaria crotonensis]|nr:hypothetical protein MHU86_7157 [Fragilaria crotonensis]
MTRKSFEKRADTFGLVLFGLCLLAQNLVTDFPIGILTVLAAVPSKLAARALWKGRSSLSVSVLRQPRASHLRYPNRRGPYLMSEKVHHLGTGADTPDSTSARRIWIRSDRVLQSAHLLAEILKESALAPFRNPWILSILFLFRPSNLGKRESKGRLPPFKLGPVKLVRCRNIHRFLYEPARDFLNGVS